MHAPQQRVGAWPLPRAKGERVYAIIFDLDAEMLKLNDPTSSREDAISAVQSFLESRGFIRKSAGLYFGDETIDAVQCILTVRKMAKKYPWFTPSVRDLRMLGIEENNDLRSALFDDDD